MFSVIVSKCLHYGKEPEQEKRRVSAKSATHLLLSSRFGADDKRRRASAVEAAQRSITRLACAHMCTYSAPLITTSEAADKNTKLCNIFHAWTCKVIMKVQHVALMKGQLLEKANLTSAVLYKNAIDGT